MRILITGGGCEEPIDGVRFVSNFSTGRTAVFLALELAAAGYDVTAVLSARAAEEAGFERTFSAAASSSERTFAAQIDYSERTAPAQTGGTANICRTSGMGNLRVLRFRTFADLSAVLQSELGRTAYGGVIHAAAVSDYGIESVSVDGIVYSGGSVPKIPSEKNVTVSFCVHPKLIDSLRSWSCSPAVKIAAFKLTNGADENERLEAVRALLKRPAFGLDSAADGSRRNACSDRGAHGFFAPAADIAVHNDLSEITGELHPFTVYAAARPLTYGCECEQVLSGETCTYGKSSGTGLSGKICNGGLSLEPVQSRQSCTYGCAEDLAVCGSGSSKFDLVSFFKEFFL